MLYYLNEVKNLIKDNENYPKLLEWIENFPVVKIPDCINSYDAYKTLRSFAKEAGITRDKILALTTFLIAIIPVLNQPKAIAEYSKDFNGVYDFQFVIDDLVKVLKNKKPTSRPKNDTKHKRYVPEYKEITVSYIFGLEYDPKTKLMRLRYKIYPQKHWWGFRYEERLRPFEDLIKFIVSDLISYHSEDLAEISIPDDPESEEDVTFEEEL